MKDLTHLPKLVQDDIRFRRGKNREMAIEIAEALLPILRKHRQRIKDPYLFAGKSTGMVAACIDAVRTE